MDKLIFEVLLKRNRGDGVVKSLRISGSSFIYTTGRIIIKEKIPIGVPVCSVYRLTLPTNRITIAKPNNYDDIYNIQGVTNG